MHSQIFRVPEKSDPAVAALVEQIVPGGEVVFLAVTPEPFAEVSGCFPAVLEKIRRDGGSMVIGWQLWQTRMMVEAEYHAVWERGDGSLHDITPKLPPIDRILFLRDPRGHYDGSTRDSFRVNISGNVLGEHFIAICEAIYALENHGQRGYMTAFALRDDEAEARAILRQGQMMVMQMIDNNLTVDSQCLCQSGSSYLSCHAPYLDHAIDMCHASSRDTKI